MPILTSSATVAGGRSVRLPGLPDFNADDPAFRINMFDGWFDGPGPVPVLVANGGAPGAVAVGDWEPAEHYYTLAGRVFCEPQDRAYYRRLLLAALPPNMDTSIACLGNSVDVDLQAFVRLFDRPTMVANEAGLGFSLPLVAPDPYKYALAPLAGDMGVFTGQSWFRDYTLSGAKWVRSYALTGSRWTRTYKQSVASGPYPSSVTLDSAGDATSRRVTVTITGPLTAGDWWLRNESTGEEMWVEVGVQAGQQLVIDMRSRTARLDGSPVDHLVYGDWLSLAPGANLFRLASGTASAAFASVTALPAYL